MVIFVSRSSAAAVATALLAALSAANAPVQPQDEQAPTSQRNADPTAHSSEELRVSAR